MDVGVCDLTPPPTEVWGLGDGSRTKGHPSFCFWAKGQTPVPVPGETPEKNKKQGNPSRETCVWWRTRTTDSRTGVTP